MPNYYQTDKYKRNIYLHHHSKRMVFIANDNCYGMTHYVYSREEDIYEAVASITLSAHWFYRHATSKRYRYQTKQH